MTELTAKPRKRLDSRTRNVRGKLLLAGPERAFELSETAARVWSYVDGSRTLSEIGSEIAAEYDVDPNVAARDAATLLTELAEHGIVEWVGNTS